MGGFRKIAGWQLPDERLLSGRDPASRLSASADTIRRQVHADASTMTRPLAGSRRSCLRPSSLWNVFRLPPEKAHFLLETIRNRQRTGLVVRSIIGVAEFVVLC